MNRAGFGSRLAAMLLDILILMPLALLLVGVMFYLESSNRLTPRTMRLMEVALGAAVLAYGSFEIFKAATPGKMLMKLRITNQDGTDAEGAKLFNRWLVKNANPVLSLVAVATQVRALDWLGNLMGFIVFLGCFATLGRSRLAWHDSWAQTAVIRRVPVEEQRGFEPLMPPPSYPPSPVVPPSGDQPPRGA